MARKPVAARAMDMPMQSPHEKKLSEMHDALHTLGSKIRKPFVMNPSGQKLLPTHLQEQEPEGAKQAKQHIDKLHAAFQGVKGGK
jgi:hypothetical protein